MLSWRFYGTLLEVWGIGEDHSMPVKRGVEQRFHQIVS
jgi:hypothetical protein